MARLSDLLGRLKGGKNLQFNPQRQPKPLAHSKWISDTLLVQAVGDELSDAMALFGPRDKEQRMPEFLHMVNLYPAPSDDATQKNTVNSMRRAANEWDGKVRLINIQAREDADQTPDGFERGPDLERSVLDLKPMTPARPLPLLFDIIDHGASLAKDDDFIVFTNADICLQPYFYDAVADLIAHGFDSLVINRRTVGEQFGQMPDSPLLPAEIGKTHPGFDCLIFRKTVYDRFIRNDACIGMAGVIMGLLYNLIAFSEKMVILNNVCMTYHFGDDLTWRDDKFRCYTDHNQAEYLATLRALLTRGADPTPLQAFFQTRYNPPPARAVFNDVLPGKLLP